MKKSLLTFLLAAAIPSGLHAANVLTTWNGGDAGTYSWANTSNWSSSTPLFHYPYNDGTDIYFAQVNDSTGARIIETGGSLTMRGLAVVQSSATGSTTLKLNSDFTATGTVTTGIPESGFYNTTGDASRLVIDLNGYHLNFDLPEGRVNFEEASNYTLRSTSPGGVFSFARLTTSATNVQVQDSVSVKLTGGGQHGIASSVNWSDKSTLIYAPAGTNGLGSTGVINLGNFVVGDSTSAQASTATLRSNAPAGNAFRVRGDFSVASHGGGVISSFAFDTTSRNLYVGGNFTDTGTTGNYNGGTIYFNNNPTGEKNVLTNRTGLNTHFQVGEDGSSAGNIKLNGNLSTSGSFTVLSNSRVNVSTHSVSAGAVQINSGATVAYTVGSSSGSIHSTGNILLNSFKLELALDDTDWVNGTDFVLFTYTGTLTGTPTLASIINPNITYDALVFDSVNKRVFLSNLAVIPEPTTWGLIGVGLLSLQLVRRGRRSL